MPYKRIGKTIYTKKSGKWVKKQTTGSIAKAEAALRLLRGLKAGSIKPSQVGKGKFAKSKKKWSREVDKKMRNYGDIDFGKKKIRVNPKKRDLLNTVIHEEMHKKFPNKPEKWIKKKSAEREKNLSIRKAMKLLNKYK